MTCATPCAFVHRAELHRGDVQRLAVDAVDERLAVLLPLAQRGRGNGEDILERAAHDAARGEGAATQRVAGIRDLHVDGDGARGRIDRRADARDLAVEPPRIGDEMHDLAGAHRGRLARGHRGRQLERPAAHDA